MSDYRWNEDIKRLSMRVAAIRRIYHHSRWGFYGTLANWFYR